MKILKFKIFEDFKNVLRHGLSVRGGGVSESGFASLNLGLGNPQNYRRFCEAVGVDEERILTSIQVHSDKILVVKEGDVENFCVSDYVPGNVYGSASASKIINVNLGWQKAKIELDGFITNVKNLPLMVRFADCQGVLFFDPVKRVIAAVHCGWRGNVQNILGKAVRKMVEEFGCEAADILVGISQSLGPCHAEFTNPMKELPGWMQKYAGNVNGGENANGKLKPRHVDLWQCSLDQLIAEGILAKNIENLHRCTVCENEIFFSYRVEGEKSGRMGGVICLN